MVKEKTQIGVNTMNILQKLSEIATDLDSKGFHSEASELDAVIKEAIDFSKSNRSVVLAGPEDSPAPTETMNFQKGTKIRGRRRYLATLRKLRKELGLGPGMFDKQVAKVLNKYYPGVWQPGKKQKASDILAAVQQKKQEGAQDTGVAMKEGPQAGPRGGEIGQTQSPSNEELFPQRGLPPDVSLGPKKEYPIDMPGQPAPGGAPSPATPVPANPSFNPAVPGPGDAEFNKQLNQRKTPSQLQHERRMRRDMQGR